MRIPVIRHVTLFAGMMLCGATSADAQLPYVVHPDVIRGIEAYESGDFPAAFRILKPFVYDPAYRRLNTQSPGMPDPWAMVYVGRMMHVAQGTARDSLRACVILRRARADVSTLEVDPRQPILNRVTAEMQDACAGQAEADIRGAEVSCFMDGLIPLVIPTLPGEWATIDVTGLHIETLSGRVEHFLPRNTCYERIVSMSSTPLNVMRGDVLVPRFFVEFFVWSARRNPDDKREERVLLWRVLEIVGRDLKTVVQEPLATLPTTSDVPETLDPIFRSNVELISNLERVEWIVRVGKTRGGSID